MRSKYLSISVMAGILLIGGCITFDPHYDHDYYGVGEIEADTIRVVRDGNHQPAARWIAIRSHDLEGWFLLRCENLKAKYDIDMTTRSSELQARFMKTPLIASTIQDPEKKALFEWHLPDDTFLRFRNFPNDPQFRDYVVKLDGRMRIHGEGNTVYRIDVDLKNEKTPSIHFRGSVVRRWHLFSINFILI